MEVTDRLRDQEHGGPPFSLAEAVITSLSLRDLYGIRRLYPNALSVDDAKEIHRLLVEHLNAALGDPRFHVIRDSLYCEPCFEDSLMEGKLSLIFATLVVQCPNVQTMGDSEKAIAESIDQGVTWCHERCSQKIQDLLLQLFEIKNHDCIIPSPKDDPSLTDTPRSPRLRTSGFRKIENASVRTNQLSGEGIDGVYCVVITREGTHFANKARYEKLVNAIDECDMFIDGMTRRVSCRDGEQKPRTEKLTPKELGILSDFIRVGKPMRPYDTKTGNGCASSSSAYRMFEKARRKVDLKLGRYVYRTFRLHKNPSDRKLNAHEFAPPDDLVYCLILPA